MLVSGRENRSKQSTYSRVNRAMQTNNDEDSAWLTNHEEEFLQNVDDDYEIARSRLDKEKEQSIKNIWTYFQDSAQYITQLYKGERRETRIGHEKMTFSKENLIQGHFCPSVPSHTHTIPRRTPIHVHTQLQQQQHSFVYIFSCVSTRRIEQNFFPHLSRTL